MSNIKITHKKQNSGFSLFTVLVAVSFIGILGMLVLYIAVANFQMKTTGLKGKDSFYTAERALEEIRTGLQQDVGDAMSKAYIQVLEDYNKNEQSNDMPLDKQRQSDFEDAFTKELSNRLRDQKKPTCYSLDYLKEYLDLDNSDKYDPEKESIIITTPSTDEPYMISGKKSGVLLKNLKVIYVDPQGRASVIRTDIRLGIPKVQFPTPSTLPDLMSMIVVAGSGIVCEAEADGAAVGTPISIQGSVYAGTLKEQSQSSENTQTSIWIKERASLDVSHGDNLVCDGEIRADMNSTFKSGTGMSLWAKGITLASADVSLLGKTYLADDLTVSTGNSSKVTICGEYYGYGYPESAKSNECVSAEENKTLSDAELNSAIVINGKNTTIDLSAAEKIMLAGKNYIGSRKIPSIDGIKNSNDIMTGESLTVKGTQLAYLAPAEIFAVENTDTFNNPMSYEDYLKLKPQDLDSIPVKWDIPVEAWGGQTLSGIEVDSEKPIQEVFYNDNSAPGGGFVYFYLNFTDDGAASRLLNYYYKDNEQMKKNMDEYLSFYFSGENTGINVKDAETYLRYVTNGNVISYEGGETAQGELKNATHSNVTENMIQDQTNFQNTWYALKRKMIISYDLLKDNVKDSEGLPHNEMKSDRNVFDNLVNEKQLVQYIVEKDPTDLKCDYEGTESGFRAIMYHNGEKSTFKVREEGTGDTTEGEIITKEVEVKGKDTPLHITKENEEKLRLVVCTGDVVIEAGVHFKGIIMAKGKITLEPGAELLSEPLEAANVFQDQTASDGVSPKDFFWEGDQYVLGNSSDLEGNTASVHVSDTYDLAECVTYENWKKQ